jgi:putative phosphoribosyl transferase
MKQSDSAIQIPVNNITLKGNLAIPKAANGIVIFSHGSGSGRLSPRNNFVAQKLQETNLGTLLIDLLTEKEDLVHENRFDIPLLTARLLSAIDWVKKETGKKSKIGLFGASTGAASALNAAAFLGEQIAAVVCRGGRPDLAMENLPQVVSPTLLIVGENDEVVIELNRQALAKLATKSKDLKIVSKASHLFEEPGTLEEVSLLAREWFKKHF